jgi:hypothetical protein
MLEKRNFAHNKQFTPGDESGFINGQGTGEVAKMKYGICTMAWNGCEMIALYNAAHLLGRHEELRDICLEMYPQSSVLWGFFGSNPLVLDRYFKAHEIPFEKTYDYNAFFNALPDCRCGVLSFWNRRRVFGSLHTVMVRFDKDRGLLVEYNKFNGKTVPVPHDVRSLVTVKHLFIVGYLLP